MDDSREHSPTALFAAFADERRQRVVASLAASLEPMSVSDLAERIAAEEGQSIPDHRERVETALVHSHLPQLQDVGLVQYDAVGGTVELAVPRHVVAPYLTLAGYTVL
ncbi:hypothetical protein C479_06881 [Halovivax asiaticus JCM 14624]|uniref:DUF7344 domain-containing protein n=1 Tax=Halovivax asiaticus JCM 14624 TaxID=1227490 RepID=M0BMQ8_9EURY|nr:hypothetical protein [Halovivax asiaticus]ELZ11568.1 hypothetical protein C479_06881 [Halovivax asiaticus JCM 14624]